MQVSKQSSESTLTKWDVRPEVSLVMPAYNVEDKIVKAAEMVENVMKRAGFNFELIIVDDGSVDHTRMRITDYAFNNGDGKVRFFGYDGNMGKGFALKKGFKYARGNIVVFVDSDLDVDPCQIVRYIKALKRGDLIVASKWHPKSKVEMPFVRKILSHGFNLLVRLLTGIRLRDTQTGLKAVRRKAFENIFKKICVKRYAFDVELLTVANLYGLRIVELPVNIRMRRSLFSLKEVWRMFLDLLGITYRLRVKKWYQREVV